MTRLAAMFRYGDAHVLQQELHLRGGGMGKIEQQNFLALVLDKVDAIVHKT